MNYPPDSNMLVDYWNDYFGISNSYVPIETTDVDKLFNSYLSSISTSLEFEWNSGICLCKRVDTAIEVYYINSNNSLTYKEFSLRAKKKFFSFLCEFEIIITDNLPLNKDIFGNTLLLRYELIRNIFTSNHTHFFDKTLPFSIDDISIFFTTQFKILLMSDSQRLENLIFSSHVLNSFELGVTINDIILKPNITISHYGRWYWSGTAKIQNDLKARNAVYERFLDYGKVLTVDLVSGEPTILSELSGSILLNKLVKYRIKLNKKGDNELSNLIKEILNIFIHSVDKPAVAYKHFKNKHSDYNSIEKELGISILDVFLSLQAEFMCYNNKVIENYKTNLSTIENGRRIVNPSSILFTPTELIKEHRKYLQGLTHDKIIRIARLMYNETRILPIFTIHDSVSYYISEENENSTIETMKKIGKQIKTPITLEIIQKEKDDTRQWQIH